MKIVAFLQNQWFRDPERARQFLREHPDKRQWFIKKTLFMGCLTGRRLLATFGVELCGVITWEEISTEIGDSASSRFRPDLNHMAAALYNDGIDPIAVLAFGSLAVNACVEIDAGPLIVAPHPAARGSLVKQRLAKAARQLRIVMETKAA